MRCLRSIALFVVLFPAGASGWVHAAEIQVPSRATPDLATALALAQPGDVLTVATDHVSAPVVHVVSTSLTLRGATGGATLPPLRVVGGALVGLIDVGFSATGRADPLGCAGLCIDGSSVTGTNVRFDGVGAHLAGGSLLLDDALFDGASVTASAGLLTLTRPVFDSSVSSALSAHNTTVLLYDAVFEDGLATAPGVGLRVEDGALQVVGATFSGGDNSAIHLINTPATLSDVALADISAPTGAGLLLSSARGDVVTIDGLTAVGLVAAHTGGVVAASGVNLGIADAVIRDVSAAFGGAVALTGGSLTLASSTVSDVSAVADGGAVWSSGAQVTLRQVSVVDAEAHRGGVVAGTGSLDWVDGTLHTSRADVGGAVWWSDGAVTLDRVDVTDSQARIGGVADLSDITDLAVRDGRWTDNRATEDGAGLRVHGPVDGVVERMTVCRHQTGGSGSGVLLDAFTNGVLTVQNNVFMGNIAVLGGALSTAASSAVNRNEQLSIWNNAVVNDVSGGGALRLDGVSFDLRNNVVSLSTVPMVVRGGAVGSGAYNAWFGNTRAPVGWSITGDVLAAPGFTLMRCDAPLYLAPGSALRDAGDPALQDPDGTRSDIGAFGGANAVIPDVDRDGTPEDRDCDDADSSVHPAADEVPYDGVDQDCDGLDSCDVDGDGVLAMACGGTDCDDDDPATRPGGPENPYDDIDQDCDGTDLIDADGDGWSAIAAGGSDCDDGDPQIHPDAPDHANDGIDQDCDGTDRTTFLAGGGGCDSSGSGTLWLWLWPVGLLWLGRRRT